MLLESKRVTVGVRIRPKLDGLVNAFQTAERYEPMACSRHSDTTLCICDGWEDGVSRTLSFAYDAVFDENTTQEEIFDELASPLVEDVLRGTNATILTYGQTGSGKTHTVLGGVRGNLLGDEIITDDTGILLRALQDLLHYRELYKNTVHLVIGLSAVEIYLDEVRDLLSDETTLAAVHMTLVRDIVRLGGLTCLPICCLEDGLNVFLKATARRAQRMTSANDTSSRSHAVFTIEVFQQPVTPKSVRPLDLSACMSMKDALRLVQLEGGRPKPLSHRMFEGASSPLLGATDAPVMHSKLSLADLAGSERVRSANVRGAGLDELRKINASLTALGNVVRSLHEGARHIPYRDSKLTTLLCDSFAVPTARVVLIVNVSPTVLTVDETLSSLHFADKVKMLKPQLRKSAVNESNVVCDYFLSLRKFDGLLAEVRVAKLLHRFCAPQLIFFLAGDKSNVLYDVAFHVRKPDCEIRQMALSMMCESLKIGAEEGSQTAAQQQQWEMEQTREVLRNKIVTKWTTKRDSMLSRVENFLTEKRNEEIAKERELLDRLDEAFVTLKEVCAARRDVRRKCKSTALSIVKAEDLVRSIEKDLQAAENVLEDADTATQPMKKREEAVMLKQQEKSWARVSKQAAQAVELANMRLDFCRLLCETQRLAATLKGHARQQQPAATRVQPVYDWLRHAVRAMAGNAVVISSRRGKRRCLRKPRVPGDNFGSKGDAMAGSRQYCPQRSSGGHSVDRRNSRGSRYDDAALLEDIMSFLKMGGKVMKCSRSGASHRRLLYVEGKAGSEALCWSTLGSMRHEGSIPLSAVTQILLGRGHDPAGPDLDHLGWGVVWRKRNSTRVLDFVCDTVAELEAWVIGLSHLTGTKPVFGEPVKVRPETRALWEGLNSSDAMFCAEWHVPPAVYMEARQQLLRRRHTRHQTGCRLSPGELRNLVKLDIFRASAMWVRLCAEGLVSEPRGRLCCYVDVLAVLKTTSAGALSFASGVDPRDVGLLKSLSV